MNKKIFLGLLILTILTTSFVSANTPAPVRPDTKREQNRQTVCVQVESRVKDRVSKRSNILDQFTKRFENLETKVENIITRVGEKFPSVDLTYLKADLSKIREMYDEAMSASVKAQKAYEKLDFTGCGQLNEQFKTDLQEARALSKDAYDAHKALWSFVRETLKSDLEDLKSQIANTKTDSE